MKQATGFINISNTSQGTVSLNCSYREGETSVGVFHDILPAFQNIRGSRIPIEDWNRIKDTEIIKALVDTKVLLPEKNKVTIGQEMRAVSEPKPTGELAEHSLNNMAQGKTAKVKQGSRTAKTSLKDS